MKKNQLTSFTPPQVSDIKITHAQRVIYPKSHLTKLDLVNYYDQISDYILPHLENRLISVVRCPQGLAGKCFFQRHENISSEFIHEFKINDQDIPYIYIKDKKGLLTLIQFGVIEIHAWCSRMDDINRPDRIIFDLDPDPKIPWEIIVDAAAEVKLRMDKLGLESFLRTTGGKGLHVVIPIKPHYEFAVIKSFARAFAQKMAADHPENYVVNMSKVKRQGKIFIDYLRNDLTSTAITSFSARAHEDATIAMPLSWDDLDYDLDPKNFNLVTISKYLKNRKSDPWEDVLGNKQTLTKALLKELGVKV